MAAPSSTWLHLVGRVAIVTGSSRGIGRAIAIHLRGDRISFASKSGEAEQFATEINNLPADIVVRAKALQPSEVKSLFDSAERGFESPLHILVNSAGILDPRYRGRF